MYITANPEWRRIGGVHNNRDGLLFIVEKFPVPGRENFFLDSTFHRTGLLDNCSDMIIGLTFLT